MRDIHSPVYWSINIYNDIDDKFESFIHCSIFHFADAEPLSSQAVYFLSVCGRRVIFCALRDEHVEEILLILLLGRTHELIMVTAPDEYRPSITSATTIHLLFTLS
jgi:hypothetical protein